MRTVNFCLYLQNRLIQTGQTGGQQYGDTSPFSIPWSMHRNCWAVFSVCLRCLFCLSHFCLRSAFSLKHQKKSLCLFATSKSWSDWKILFRKRLNFVVLKMAKFGLAVLASLAIVVSLTRGEEQQRPLKVASILVSVKMQKKLSFFFS